MNLETVKIFDDAISAHILITRLESEGIECFIFDENIVTLDPLLNFAVGGVKVKVKEEDLKSALEIIEEIERSPFTTENEELVRCPNCNSTELYADFKSMKGVKGILTTITSFFLQVFPIYFNSVFRCKNCETEFKLKR